MASRTTLMQNLDNRKIHAPFRYAGGKFYALKHILPIIPDHESYVEPFCGGSRVYFAKKKSAHNWLNDIDDQLVNCYRHIRDKPQEMSKILVKEKATKPRHMYYKNEYRPRTNFKKAVRWYYLNRTSFSGIMKKENCYFGYGEKYSLGPEGWGSRILSCSAKIQNVNLTSMDFEKVIDTCPDGSFLFVDPPYFSSDQHKFYTFSFELEDHMRLCDVLKRNSRRIKFLLTYDNVDQIQKMYSWTTNRLNMEWLYAISRTDQNQSKGKRSMATELFITNYKIRHLDTL